MNRKNIAAAYALLAAVLYGIQVPFSKLLESGIDSLFLAALLYLGAGIGMIAVRAVELRAAPIKREAPLEKKDLPYVMMMILLDIAAPILLLAGLKLSSAGTVSLLGNFEIAATAVLAMLFFRESVGKRLWISIGLVTSACILLSVEDLSAIRVSSGSVLVLLACLVWGLENNCTRSLSGKNPMHIVIIKGCGSGTGALIIALFFGRVHGPALYIVLAGALGFIAFGLSIFFYVKAQRELGAARTSAFYAAAPFVGVLLSWLILREPINGTFLFALVLMIAGSLFGISEKHNHMHVHLRQVHEHAHSHSDGHHTHTHDYEVTGEHTHVHTHEEIVHDHPHTPDTHHRHTHVGHSHDSDTHSHEGDAHD